MNEIVEIVNEFLAESREHLDQAERDLVELEKDPTSAELIARVFRAVHTIKAACGFLEFSRLEALAHAQETLLSQVRSGYQPLTSEIVALLLAALDRTRAILREVESSGGDGESQESELIEQFTIHTVRQPLSDSPTEEADKPLGQLLVETAGVSPFALDAALGTQKEGDPRPIGEILVEHGAVSRSMMRSVVEYQKETRARSVADTSVRIEFAVLARLACKIKELVVVRNQLLQSERSDYNPAPKELMRRLDQISTDLEALLVQSFLQPLGSIWMRLPRVVRDIAAAEGKQVRLETHGHDIQVDRRVLEAIKDSLIHLVRNSIDHGIESPDVRRAIGKPIEGRVSIRAFHEAMRLVVEVADDGAGIDFDRVKTKALAMGLITEHQARHMNDQELASLVFLPGVSTVQRVTKLSGRGVGMDIVRTNVEKIGGTVVLANHKGQGLKVIISLPLAAPDERF